MTGGQVDTNQLSLEQMNLDRTEADNTQHYDPFYNPAAVLSQDQYLELKA